jgi:hypothetical protein
MCTYKESGGAVHGCTGAAPATARSRALSWSRSARGDAAMTEPILLGKIELRRGQPALRKPEIGIIAEAARAQRRLEQQSLPDTLGDQRGQSSASRTNTRAHR